MVLLGVGENSGIKTYEIKTKFNRSSIDAGKGFKILEKPQTKEEY